ncbi:MAG: hypothetical protein LQ350_000832 [Teloschistes chrysophthalmus]|nr:MAG: hypothetical protein LQ350_000832 [Niorma chrysophthalma]
MVKGYGKKGGANNLALQLQRLQISSPQNPIKPKKAVDEQNQPIDIENPDIGNRQPLVPIDPNVEISKHSNKGLPTFEGEQTNQSLEKAQRATKSNPSEQTQTIKQARSEKQRPPEKESVSKQTRKPKDQAQPATQPHAENNPKPSKKSKKTRKSLLPPSPRPSPPTQLSLQLQTHLSPLISLPDLPPTLRPFTAWATEWSSLCHFTKIAQGSYGAVFRIESRAHPNTFTIGKFLPMQAARGFGSRTRSFTSVESAAREVEMLGVMEGVEGFVEFRGAEVLQGKFPEQLGEAARVFDEGRQGEEDDVPAVWQKAGAYKEQLWLFLEMSDAGTDLETALVKGLPSSSSGDGNETFLYKASDGNTYLDASTAWDIFRQVATALAIAEREMEFEHRDLHLGNICLLPLTPSPPSTLPSAQTTRAITATDSDAHQQQRKQEDELDTPPAKVRVTIIDYTLSRARLPSSSTSASNPTTPSSSSTNPSRTLFNDLTRDPEIFTGEGELQYDIYRSMRSLVRRITTAEGGSGGKGGKKGEGEDWSVFEPGTNVLWLGHLLLLLMGRVGKGEGAVWERLEGLREGVGGLVLGEEGGEVEEGGTGGFGSAGDVVWWFENSVSSGVEV